MKKAKLFMMLALLVMGVSNLFAQNVTISPTSGNLVAALTTNQEVGFDKGWSAMWRHEQLPLTFTVSDETGLTIGGEVALPAGNLNLYNGFLVLAGGPSPDSHCVLSLPRGYRFTGYKLVMLDNLNGSTINELSIGNNVTKTMYEVAGDGYWNTSNAKAQSATMNGTNSEREYVIERESHDDTDMGNQLYFILDGGNNSSYYAVTIKSFEVYFTAEGTFPAEVTPDRVGPATSVVTSPFKTSKIDIGDLKQEKKKDSNGVEHTYFAYNYNNVKDLDANIYIYQDDAVANGVPSDVATDKHIYPVEVGGKKLFAFCSDTYYAEPPIQVHTQTGLEAPVGYRIVGADFNCLWGNATTSYEQTISNACQITFTYEGTQYFLNDQLHFTETPFSWQIDESGNITANGKYLSCGGNYELYRSLTTSSSASSKYNLRRAADGRIYYKSSSSNWYLEFYNQDANYGSGVTPIVAREGYTYGTYYRNPYWEYGMYSEDYVVTSTYESKTEIIPAFTPGAYTLTVYGKDGTTTGGGTATVNNASQAGKTVELRNLNNDAVKFKVEAAEGCQALISVTLFLEALDPYINSMNIACEDAQKNLQLSQTFTASDFKVSGGKLYYYVPQDYADTELTFKFTDLFSNYGDDTYYNNTSSVHNSRYSFVTSEYFEKVDGYGDNGLYNNTNYSPSAPYTNKVVAATAGNIRFKFNNAEDLKNTSDQEHNYLIETPFTVEKYLGSEDPDGGDNTGAFNDVKLKASVDAQKAGTFYVFTADETRYNIAPTTAWQHRYYAFYRMDIEVQAKTYTPDLTWKKLYDKTYYRVKKDSGEETKTHSMWGVELKAKDGNKIVDGYLTVQQILDEINSDINNSSKQTADGTDQILYIDGSNLYSITNSSIKSNGTTTTRTVAQLKEGLGANAIIFLPENTTSTLDNFAYMTSSGSFRAGKDIVITDKQPFFSPYDIQIESPNVAKYDRMLTSEQNGQVCNASVVLPFDIDLDDEGYHDIEGGGRFYLAKLKDNQTLKKEVGNDINTAKAFFDKITEKKGAANTPYVVKVENQNKEDENISFKVRCVGSKIVATPYQSSEAGIKTNGIFTPLGSVRGYYGGDEYNFTPTGTFRGYTFENAGNASTKEQIFYFARNSFYTSKTLRANEPMLVQPFRSYFDYTVNGTNNSKLSRFFISFDDSDEFGGTNGINEFERDVDLAVIPGKGVITLVARADKDVTIHAVNGQTIDKCNLNAGESRTVSVPAGVYVINGVKMVVK